MPYIYYRRPRYRLTLLPSWHSYGHSLVWYLFMSPVYALWIGVVAIYWLLVFGGGLFVLFWQLAVAGYKSLTALARRS